MYVYSHVFRPFGRLVDWYTGFSSQTLAPKKGIFKAFFLYFNKKYVEVAINHSQCILLFRNSLEGNADRREKQEGRRERKLSMKVFSFI